MSHQSIAPYNFFKGHPSVELLPTKAIMQATIDVMKRFDGTMADYDDLHNTHPLDYGTDPGNLEVRTQIAKWNDRNFRVKTPTNPDCLNLTCGASLGLVNVLQQFTSPHNGVTRRAFIVSPTYFLINSTMIDGGFGGKFSAVVEQKDGQIDLKEFERLIKKYEVKPHSKITPDIIKQIYDPSRPIKKVYTYVMYVVPSFSNPKGGSLSEKTKLGLIELARKYDILIICDDVYDLLDYTGAKEYQRRMVYLDRETLPEGDEYGHVLSNATFSKLLGPGLRAGYQESATPKLAYLLSQGGAIRSGGTPAQLNTIIISKLLEEGIVDQVIAKLVKTYSGRAKLLKKAIHEYLPEGTAISGFEGGYFGWITLPDGYDLAAISKECKKRGVVLATGDSFEVMGDIKGWGKHGVRLSLSFLPEEKLEKGIQIFGEVCKNYLK